MQTELASGGGLVLRFPAPGLRLVVPVLAAAAAVAAAALSHAQPALHRAEATVVVGRGGGLAQPRGEGRRRALVATAAALVRSNVVATNVVEALGLEETPEQLLDRIHVSTRDGASALAVAVDDRDPEQAQRVAQEVGLVFAQLVRQRFGADGTTATVFDPPHPSSSRVPSHALRNALLAALAVLLVGGAAALGLRPLRAGGQSLGRVRIGRVRGTVPRAPAAPRRPTLVPAPAPEPEPEPAPQPTPEPQPDPDPLPPAADALRVADLELRVAAARERADADRLAEWDAYLGSLRGHARPDGTLPPTLEPLARDVFADLLASDRIPA